MQSTATVIFNFEALEAGINFHIPPEKRGEV